MRPEIVDFILNRCLASGARSTAQIQQALAESGFESSAHRFSVLRNSYLEKLLADGRVQFLGQGDPGDGGGVWDVPDDAADTPLHDEPDEGAMEPSGVPGRSTLAALSGFKNWGDRPGVGELAGGEPNLSFTVDLGWHEGDLERFLAHHPALLLAALGVEAAHRASPRVLRQLGDLDLVIIDGLDTAWAFELKTRGSVAAALRQLAHNIEAGVENLRRANLGVREVRPALLGPWPAMASFAEGSNSSTVLGTPTVLSYHTVADDVGRPYLLLHGDGRQLRYPKAPADKQPDATLAGILKTRSEWRREGRLFLRTGTLDGTGVGLHVLTGQIVVRAQLHAALRDQVLGGQLAGQPARALNAVAELEERGFKREQVRIGQRAEVVFWAQGCTEVDVVMQAVDLAERMAALLS